jgi:hypothetical protein
MKITIQNEEWPIRFLSEKMLSKIALGDASVVDDVLNHGWRREFSEMLNEDDVIVPLAVYEAHAIAAGYGHPEIARTFYERGGLDKVLWNSSDLDGAYPSRVCPICFTLTNEWGLSAPLDCSGGHLVFRSSSDLPNYELKDADEINVGVFSDVISESNNFEKIKKKLFTDDVAGRALYVAAGGQLWLKELHEGEQLRIFTEFCDVDEWGSTFLYGYHPDGSAFVERIMECYQQMIERCQECGLDACEDHF